MRRLGYLDLFFALSLLAAVAVPLYSVFAIYPAFEHHIVEDIEDQAVRVTTHLSSMLPSIEPEDMGGGMETAFSMMASSAMRDFQIMRIKLFKLGGVVVYDSDGTDLGKRHEGGEFDEVLEDGKTRSELVRRDERSLEGQAMRSDMVEVYIPLITNGRVRGVFEIYYEVTDELAGMDRLVRHARTGVVAISLLLLVSLGIGWKSARVSIRKREEVAEAMKLAKEAAESASRSKSYFLAAVSHELRNPMNGVIGMTDLAMQGELGGEQRQLIEAANKSASSLLALLNDLLDFSRIEAGKLSLESVEFSVREVIGDSVTPFALDAYNKRNELIVDVEPDVPGFAVGDPLRLRQVLVNLVSNAMKFTKGGRIVVRARALQGSVGMVEFSVEDTGVGIAPERIPRLFESFEQAEAYTARMYGGSGLGLNISSRIVQMMGGGISVESAVGKGSRFTFSVRLGASAATEPRKLAGLRAMVAGGAEVSARAIASMLAHEGAAADVETSLKNAALMADKAFKGGRPYDFVFFNCSCRDTDECALLVGRFIGEDAARGMRFIVPCALTPFCGDVTRLAPERVFCVNRPLIRSDILSALGMGDASSRQTSLADPAQGSGLDVLVVEDNEIGRRLLVKLVERRGHRAVAAESAAAALEKVSGGHVDVVLMDMHLPDMEGVECLRRIRAIGPGPTRPDVPVILVTAHAMSGDRERFLSEGFDAYVAKPVAVADLYNAMKAFGG